MEQRPIEGLAAGFDGVAELYERARPRYPSDMFDALALAVGSPGTPPRVLEIGAGTGQATRGMLARGWRVVALEPGPELARVARSVLAGLGDAEVVVAPFEHWDDGGERFDAVIAATSWHWLDQTIAYRRAAELLRPGGRLAIVATEHVLPDGEGDPFFVEVEESYEAVGMGDGKGGPAPPDRLQAPDADAIEASGFFGPPTVHRYVWSAVYSADEYLALISTYSGHIAAPPDVRKSLFDDIRRRIDSRPEASVRKHYLTFLQLATVLD